jgi:hypothetical protein
MSTSPPRPNSGANELGDTDGVGEYDGVGVRDSERLLVMDRLWVGVSDGLFDDVRDAVSDIVGDRLSTGVLDCDAFLDHDFDGDLERTDVSEMDDVNDADGVSFAVSLFIGVTDTVADGEDVHDDDGDDVTVGDDDIDGELDGDNDTDGEGDGVTEIVRVADEYNGPTSAGPAAATKSTRNSYSNTLAVAETGSAYPAGFSTVTSTVCCACGPATHTMDVAVDVSTVHGASPSCTIHVDGHVSSVPEMVMMVSP